jgi:hypothetical protein
MDIAMEILRYALIALSILAGISVLRNPLRVWPNTLAGISYFLGAIASILLFAWWPILVGWIVSLALQGVCALMMSKGLFNEKINSERIKNGLPTLDQDD